MFLGVVVNMSIFSYILHVIYLIKVIAKKNYIYDMHIYVVVCCCMI